MCLLQCVDGGGVVEKRAETRNLTRPGFFKKAEALAASCAARIVLPLPILAASSSRSVGLCSSVPTLFDTLFQIGGVYNHAIGLTQPTVGQLSSLRVGLFLE